MRNDGDLDDMDYDPEIMCRHAFDRSQGGLVEIDIGYFGTDDLLNYIAVRYLSLSPLHSLSLGIERFKLYERRQRFTLFGEDPDDVLFVNHLSLSLFFPLSRLCKVITFISYLRLCF